jgi:hypothetical protein
MIPVRKARKPRDFDAKVLHPGLRSIAEKVGKTPKYPRTAGEPFEKIATRERDIPSDKFHPYWREALDDLMHAYNNICAYSCFRIHSVTGARSVDHFAAKSQHWREIYKWSNYRLCCALLNSRKNKFNDVIDPFDVQHHSFILELVGFQVMPNPTLPAQDKLKIQETIDRLGLDDFKQQRAQDAESYWDGDISLAHLTRESPFVAAELRRQGRLRADDL